MDRTSSTFDRDLPEDILTEIDKIVVHRIGDDDQSYMITDDVIGYVAPGTSYRATLGGLIPTETLAAPKTKRNEQGSAPAHVRVSGTWTTADDTDAVDANILGGFGTLALDRAVLEIPEAPSTVDALAYYDAHLIKLGDSIKFETDANLPVTLMSIGSTYVEHYLKLEEKGGGTYIEYHDRPHFHMPIDETASGHMILGHSRDGDFVFSGFEIPFGYAIYTSPYVLHADAYLVGKFLVVYSVTDDFSTVIMRSTDRRLVDVRIA
jgi:hypothetical protein